MKLLHGSVCVLDGLPVSHVWLSDYFTLYLELGALRPGRVRKDGSIGNPLGDVTIYAGTGWRLERAGSIVGARLSSKSKRTSAALAMQGTSVISNAVFGRLPELQIELSGGVWLTTFADAEGQPEWTVGFNSKGAGHLCVFRGRLQMDPPNPTFQRTAMRPLN